MNRATNFGEKSSLNRLILISGCRNDLPRDSLEHSKSQTGLCDGVPRSLHQMFKFCCPELAEENLPHEFAHENDHDERLEIDDGHAGVGLGDVDHGGVELLALHPGVGQDQPGEGQTGSRQYTGSHLETGEESEIWKYQPVRQSGLWSLARVIL